MSDVRRIRSRREWDEASGYQVPPELSRRAATVLALVAIGVALILAFVLL